MSAGLWLFKEPTDSVSPSELRYSIRAAFKRLSIDEVWIVGDLPPWAVNVGHVPGGDPWGSKFGQLFEDLRLACSSPDLPADFVLMNDDFHALQSYEPAVEHGGSLVDRIEALNGRHGAFGDAFVRSLEWLQARGVSDPLTYELHRPLPMRKDDVRAALDEAAAHCRDFPLHARTVYGALCGIGGASVTDRKLYGAPTADEWQALDLVSTAESAWQGHIGRWLRAQSPDPSPFER